MDGILRCSRYSFGPNRLHYCGPDANSELLSYIQSGSSDLGLLHLLRQFKTLYPYLQYIAASNGIKDPFDDRVVEAYWIGNELLESIDKRQFYRHLSEDQQLKKRLGPQEFERLANKLHHRAVPHHSFHVLNVWRRTGHDSINHTLESFDACRIGWGEVKKIDGPFITVKTEPLLYLNNRFVLGDAVSQKITRQLEAPYDIEQLKIGHLITIHWGVPCEVITSRQATNLKKYTLHSIKLANQTL